MNVEALRILGCRVTKLLELRHKLGVFSHSTVKSQWIQQRHKQFFKLIAAGFGLAFVLFAVGIGSYYMTKLVETFNQRSEVASLSARAYVFAFSSSILLNFFFLVGVYYLIHREMQRQGADEALGESEARKGRTHDELELRVRERTKELIQINEALQHSEQCYRFLADTMPQIVWTAQPDGASNYYNQYWYDYTGMTFEQTKDWGFILVLHPDDRQLCLERWSKAIQTGSSYEIEYRKRASDGTYRWHLGRALPMRNQNAEIVQWVGTCTDIHEQKQAEAALFKAYEQLELKVQEQTAALEQEITERKRAEKQIKLSLQEKEVLLKEIHHRVKNNLQVVESLLRLQSKYTKNEHAVRMLKESQSRIKSMALIHEKLYQSINLAQINFLDYIQSLVASLFRSYSINSTAITPKIDVADIFMSIDTAIPCGLIINELVTNSLKYAFTDKHGEIYIYLRSKDEHKFILIVSDNGVGFPKGLDFRNTKTLGLQLVTSLTEQLGAIIELHSHSGTEFMLTFTDVKSEAKFKYSD